MHFAEDFVDDPLFIREYQPGLLKTNAAIFSHPVILLNDQAYEHSLPALVDELQTHHFQALVDLAPDLILLGTGSSQKFPQPILLEPLFKSRIGYEIMTTDAACRTYNLLLAEGRSVLAALFL